MVQVQKCYCAFCRTPRKISHKRHLSLINVLLSLLTSGLVMYLLWRGLDARALMVFVFILSVTEFFIQLRWRMSMTCPHCGFDPIIYKQDHEKAAAQVKRHLEKRKNDPMTMFSQHPKLNLPTIKKKGAEQRINSKSTLLDRTI